MNSMVRGTHLGVAFRLKNLLQNHWILSFPEKYKSVLNCDVAVLASLLDTPAEGPTTRPVPTRRLGTVGSLSQGVQEGW